MSAGEQVPMYWQETLDGAMGDMLALYEAHRAEVGKFSKHGLPDLDAYRALWGAGWLRVYTARQGTIPRGSLMGYCMMIARRDMHSEDVLAVEDSIYIRPEFRGFGLRFIKWIDDQLLAEGVSVVNRSCKADHSHAAIFDLLGYQPVDIVHGKRLKGASHAVPT